MTQSLADGQSDVRPENPRPREDWREQLRTAFRHPVDLCRHLELPDALVADVGRDFPLLVPRSFADRMRRGDPCDPLLRQVLPHVSERTRPPGYSLDPVGDVDATAERGVIRKYKGRALIIANGACAIHCRYCFRRHYPYSTAPSTLADWEPSFAQIESDSTITEAILSGGDPLTLVDGNFARLVRRIDSIPHVERIRVHTRLPVVIPSRVTDRLVEVITGLAASCVVVLHVNHPNELDSYVGASLKRLASSGATLLNQSVLLAGVNDRAATLRDLSLELFEYGVLPYYLHRLDRVEGAAHFETDDGTGERIIATLREELPGYLVPRFVADTLASSGKTVLA